MNQDNDNTFNIICLIGIIPVIWLALIIAPFIRKGLAVIISEFPVALNEPFKITLCEDSIKTIFTFLLIYVLGIAMYWANKKNYRRGEEHGSAKWGNKVKVNKQYKMQGNNNKILTQNVAIGLDGRFHRRNLNVLVCGGSRSWKNKILL